MVLASHMLRSASPASGVHACMVIGCLHPTQQRHAQMLGLLPVVVSGVMLLPSATKQGQL